MNIYDLPMEWTTHPVFNRARKYVDTRRLKSTKCGYVVLKRLRRELKLRKECLPRIHFTFSQQTRSFAQAEKLSTHSILIWGGVH